MEGLTEPKQRGRPRNVFTPEVLQTIPLWISDGLTPADIAAALGSTEGSLRMSCSLHGIDLRPGGSFAATLVRRLGSERWARIQTEAGARGITPAQLAVRLLVTAVDGDLVDAILDDKDKCEF